jgi:hypothetical protein
LVAFLTVKHLGRQSQGIYHHFYIHSALNHLKLPYPVTHPGFPRPVSRPRIPRRRSTFLKQSNRNHIDKGQISGTSCSTQHAKMREFRLSRGSAESSPSAATERWSALASLESEHQEIVLRLMRGEIRRLRTVDRGYKQWNWRTARLDF